MYACYANYMGKKIMMTRYLAITLSTLLLLQACSDSSDQRPTQTQRSSLTVVPTAAPEGAPGEMRSLNFRVTLTAPQTSAVELTYGTSAGTATAGEDYLDAAGELSIAAGEIEGVISVDMIGGALPYHLPSEARDTLRYSASATAAR